ncbi:type III secretion system stalk subunit SctO [Comamonas endophytica]|uniref:Type III secretion protein n=1 Tax=Comamonas endophytica TaxID=2949090 RepID=A0ABY6GCK6_9BURK|nr:MULTISPECIES: YscO family type III secretion system apparatus protein [unclassified Acidovorax]MCD2512837.1 type III secretion protein [Acidovorax sp. D4N7]UYG52814.1 type III secretion protein [Acidovorax sp. 5MLIR]
MNMLDSLLAIKRFRQGQAETAMRQQRQALEQARQERVAAEELLTRLLADGVLAEQRLYAGLYTRLVHLGDIEDVRLAVAALRQGEQRQQDARDRAQRGQEEAQQYFDQARARHQEAARQTSKYIELSSSFSATRALASERREDLEMEEAASVRRERENWGASDGDNP